MVSHGGIPELGVVGADVKVVKLVNFGTMNIPYAGGDRNLAE